ncbi:MAG: TonB-dependent receptor [Novosphingobium sp.]|nr:TonB-dependent receptor [Novosphingobium sp.]
MKAQKCLWVRSAMILCAASHAAMAAAQPAVNEDGLRESAVADAAAATMEDIVVTAQRRSERLRDVPLSISAVSGDNLVEANVQNIRDLTRVAPALSFLNALYSPQPTIRGIGTRGVNPGDESVVPVYIDGVYQAFVPALNLDLSDIERIEVLQGPQSVLYGRNAIGGALNVVTRAPESGFTGDASLSYGRFNQFIGRAYVSGGSDVVTFNLAGQVNRDDGYIRDVVRRKDIGKTRNYAARAQVRISPSADFELRLSGAYVKNNGQDGLAYRPLDGNTLAASAPGNRIDFGHYQAGQSFTSSAPMESYQLAVTAVGRAGAFQFTSITGYQDATLDMFTDLDGTAAAVGQFQALWAQRSIYHEDYLTTQWDGPVNLIAGGVYFHADDDYRDYRVTAFGATSVAGQLSGTTDSLAGYVQATAELTPAITMIAGGRYTYERRTANLRYSVPAVSLRKKASFDRFTPTVTLQYRPDASVNLYARYAQAFKSGLINLTATSAAALAPLKPEKVTQYELGAKLELARSLRVDLAGYYTDYKDLQTVARGADGSAFLQNAGKARIYGGEAQINWQVAPGFDLRAGIAALKATYRDFPNASVSSLPRTTGDAGGAASNCFVNPGAPTGGNRTVICDVTGKDLYRTPRVQANIGGNYVVPLGEGGIRLSANLQYTSSLYWDSLNVVKEPERFYLSASAAWKPSGDGLEISVWGENLLNERYAITTVPSAFSTLTQLARPITGGVRVSASF